MNILITGASGFIGCNLIQALIKTPHNITACIHKTELPYNIKIFKVDYAQMLKITDWLPLLIGIDVVINCAGIINESKKHSFDTMHHLAPIALFGACDKTHVKRIIQISALGADDSALVAFHKSKKLADDYLKEKKLEWIILKPSLVYGKGGKSFSFFKKLSNLPITPLIGDGEQLIQPVSIETLIDVIIHSIHSKQNRMVLDVVGKQKISYKTWMQQLRQKKSPIKFINIPLYFMQLIATIFKPFHLKLLSNDNLIMLQQNNIANPKPLTHFMENNS